MASPADNQVEVPTTKQAGSVARLAVDPLKQVAVAVLYGQRVVFTTNEDRAKALSKRRAHWLWEKTASDDELDAAEMQAERSLENPPGEMEVASEDPDPQFGSAPDSLVQQLKQAGTGEVVQRGLGRSAHVNTRLPLAAVLVISHGNAYGEIIPYTYLEWKYFTRRRPWRQWRDKRTRHGWDLKDFVDEVGIRKGGFLVLYGCKAGSPGSGMTRREAANSAGIWIGGWPELMDWEVPGAKETEDPRPKRAWNMLTFEHEEALRMELRAKKAKLIGTGHVGPEGSPVRDFPGALVPPTITEPRGEESLEGKDLVSLIRSAARAIVAARNTTQGAQKSRL